MSKPPLTGKNLLFEPKYDGIRALVHVAPGKPRPDIRLWSRLGNEKTSQFPAVVRALEPLARALRAPLLIDGEIVALDDKGRPAGFQKLQGRIHVKGERDIDMLDRQQPTAFLAFDLLRAGAEDIRGLPLTARREALEKYLERHLSDTLRISEQVAGDGRRPRQARAPGGMGRADRQGRLFYVSVGPAHSGVAEAQAVQPGGVRGRRLDRTAQHTVALRRAAARPL